MAKVTITDIAKLAGVSPATVSMVLSNRGKISDGVIAKVKAIANDLGYIKVQKAATANHVVNQETVGILCDVDPEWDFAWNFIRPVFTNIESTLKEENYFPLFIPIHLNVQIDDIFNRVVSSKVCGLFSMHYGNLNLFRKIESIGIPVVIINNSNFQNVFHSVCVDDFRGCFEGTNNLIKNGHKNIGYIDYERPDMQTLVDDRYMGYKNALENEDIKFNGALRITTQMNNMQDLHESLEKMFRQNPDITGLVCHDDYLANNVIAVLNKLNKHVPQDVSIIAPGDVLNYNEPHVPRITTMRINNELMGKTAGEIMISRLKTKYEGIQVLKVNQELIDRGSVRNLKGS